MKDTVESNDNQLDKWNDLINNQDNDHSSSSNVVDNTDDLIEESNQNNDSSQDVELPSIEDELDPLIIDLDFS
jgi:hypothetical protein